MTVKLVTLDEAAAQLNVSVRTLRRMIDEKRIPAYRFGAAWRLNIDEVLEASRFKSPTSETISKPTGSRSKFRTPDMTGDRSRMERIKAQIERERRERDKPS